jgi:hypothetical protein
MRSEFIGGTLSRVAGAILVGLEPVVFLVGGIYAGSLYGGIVSAFNRRPALVPALVRSRIA